MCLFSKFYEILNIILNINEVIYIIQVKYLLRVKLIQLFYFFFIYTLYNFKIYPKIKEDKKKLKKDQDKINKKFFNGIRNYPSCRNRNLLK